MELKNCYVPRCSTEFHSVPRPQTLLAAKRKQSGKEKVPRELVKEGEKWYVDV